MRLSALVVASALLTWSASPVLAQGVMIRRPAAAPQAQEAPRAEPKTEAAPAPVQEPKTEAPKAQDPREDIRKIVREELRAAMREMRAAEARVAEKKPEVVAKPDAAPTKPAPAPQAVAVTPAEPAPPARPMRVRAMQQQPQQDPAAPKPVAKTEPAAKKSQEEVIAELEAELRGIQAEIERSMATEKKPVAKAPEQTKQEPAAKPKPREPKAIAVQPPQPAEGQDAPRRMMVRMQEREGQDMPAPTEAKKPATIRSYTGEVMEGQPRRMMVLRTDEGAEQPMVIEVAPEEFDRKIERDLRMQAEKGGIRVFRAETRAEQPQGEDRGGCKCNCDCCQQHRGGAAQQHEPSAPQPRPQQDRIRWRAAPGMPGDNVEPQMQMGMPMPPMAQGERPPMGPMQMNPEARKQAMDRLRAQIEVAQRRLRAMEEADRGQDQDRGPARDGRGRNMEFRRGRDV